MEELIKLPLLSKELVNKIIKQIGSSDLEDLEVEVEHSNYYFEIHNEGEWESDGCEKYFYRTNIYQLSEELDDGTVKKYNVFFSQSTTKSGSYFTDWYYEYDNPKVLTAVEHYIPEQIIPAHTEIRFNSFFYIV